MNRIFKFIMALVVIVCSGLSLRAQMPQMPPLPVDSAVRVGTLPNGLTYYIRHNELPKGQADFYIAQKVGSALEEDNQRGLAHFLEHMCFNGTTNFPGKNMINWLETVGVKFGDNLNAATWADKTVYNISNVPVARKGVQDSCLLILHDWADAVTLDPKEIDAERGVIHQEWRKSNNGQQRVVEELLPIIYGGSRWGSRLPIGTMEVVDNFPAKDLVAYYDRWYRPDLQGIIVVGDIDPDYIEGKIKEIFGPIQMPADAPALVYPEVTDNQGTIYAIGADPEIQQAAFNLFVKSDVLPRELRNTQAYYIQDYVQGMISRMINARLAELASKPDCVFARGGVYFGNFLLANNKDAFTVSGAAKGGNILGAYETIYREVLRAIKGGFNDSEYERAKAELLSQYENAYNNRKSVENDHYSHEIVNTFIEGVPMPGIELEYEVYKALTQQIPVQMINMMLPEMITEDNRALLVLMPEGEGFTTPTEAQFAEITAKVDGETLEAHVDNAKTEPLIPNLPKAGKVTKETKLPEFDAVQWTLSNGVKVIVKPTNFKDDEIKMEAIALGGTAGYKNDKIKNLPAVLRTLSLANYVTGLYNYTSNDLEKYLAGKHAGVMFVPGATDRTLQGECNNKDLKVMMELLYATMTGYTIYADELEALKAMFRTQLENQEKDPKFHFSKNLKKALYKADAMQVPTAADLDMLTPEATMQIVKGLTANAADYTFVFVGNIDLGTFKPLVEQYIATLPANAKAADKARKAFKVNPDYEIPAGSETNTFATEMKTPQTYVFASLSGDVPYTAKNRMTAMLAGNVIDKRLLTSIREEKGAVYSISMSGSMGRVGSRNVMLQTSFPMKPEMKDEVLAEIRNIIESAANDVTEAELQPYKEFMVKKAKQDAEDNGELLGTIAAIQLNGVNTLANPIETINSVTVDDVKALLKELLKQNNYRVVVLDPK